MKFKNRQEFNRETEARMIKQRHIFGQQKLGTIKQTNFFFFFSFFFWLVLVDFFFMRKRG